MSDSDNRADFGPLKDLLLQQLTQYQKLLQLAEEKRDCLINVDAEKLEKLVQGEQMQLRQLASLEKKRLSASARLCRELGLSEPQTLADLLAHCQGEEKTQLSQVREDFLDLAAQLIEANKINRQLLQTNMELNDFMLDLLALPEDPLNNFYGADGNEAEERISSPSIFDQQI